MEPIEICGSEVYLVLDGTHGADKTERGKIGVVRARLVTRFPAD